MGQRTEVSLEEARKVAQNHLDVLYAPDGLAVRIADEYTITLSFGWGFCYNTIEALSTGDPRKGLAGNGPIVVTYDGHLHHTGTGVPLEFYLRPLREQYRRRHPSRIRRLLLWLENLLLSPLRIRWGKR